MRKKEHFNHCYLKVPCSYSMMIEIDVLHLRKHSVKLYPIILKLITGLGNKYKVFRTALDYK